MAGLYDLIYPNNNEFRHNQVQKKGQGYFGPLLGNNGISTELSFDFEYGGKKIHAPLLVPSLSRQEIDHLLSGGAPNQGIYSKASQYALDRLLNGKSPFASLADIMRLPK